LAILLFYIGYMDRLTPGERSRLMSKIRSKDTKPELIVRRYLHAKGFRYRLHDKSLPGKPDLVFPKYQTVLFIHGCFWHGHKICRPNNTPKSNKSYWVNKLERNIIRDQQNVKALSEAGWRVFVIYECELSKTSAEMTLLRVSQQIVDKK
jgi:DNA mismatch endonuclease (patch repair protein)